MTSNVSRLDLTQIFCDVDDFYQHFERHQNNYCQLPTSDRQKPCYSRLCLSEVMTIVIAFHGSGYKTFKEFYLNEVLSPLAGRIPQISQLWSLCRINPLVIVLIILFSQHS